MMKHSKGMILVFSFVLLSLLFTFQNCERGVAVRLESASKNAIANDLNGDGNGNNDPSPTDDNPILVVDDLIKKCDTAMKNGTLKTMTVNINFPKLPNISSDPNQVQYCNEPTPFVRSDNNIGERHYNSYAEQRAGFELPVNSTLCHMDFIFGKQLITYDDHFLFSFDDRVLASNSNGVMSYLKNESDLVLDNQMLKNKSFVASLIKHQLWGDDGKETEDFYCLGESVPGTVCQWPITETEGVIKMDYPPVVLMQIAHQKKSNKHDFSLVVTGDNDPASDCQHTPINFKVDVLYAN